MQLSFLGATGTVTGSKYLLDTGSQRILIDCGLFQGFKQLRLRNWAPLPFDPKRIDAVVLTHAHIDHSGYLPVLMRHGFSGPIYASAATRDLCAIVLPDAGHLQEEEAQYANRHGFSKHKPALPLFSEADGERVLQQFRALPFAQEIALGDIRLRLLPAGHILGAAMVHMRANDRSLLFSGDLGRTHDAIMPPPAPPPACDYLVVESTYGNRRHNGAAPERELAAIVNRTVHRGGIVLIPAFAVGRAQSILFHLARLKAERAIPDIPVYLNSPMAADVTALLQHHRAEHRLSDADADALHRVAQIVNSVEESRALNARPGPMIVISASGMATGGRVLHHLKAWASDARNTIVFVGFQAGGTRGEALLHGADQIKIHGAYIPVHAEIASIDSMSAHADYVEIIDWMAQLASAPRMVYVTHGEPAAADALRQHIEERLHWPVTVPDYREQLQLD